MKAHIFIPIRAYYLQYVGLYLYMRKKRGPKKKAIMKPMNFWNMDPDFPKQ